jgi:hypothetical protein
MLERLAGLGGDAALDQLEQAVAVADATRHVDHISNPDRGGDGNVVAQHTGLDDLEFLCCPVCALPVIYLLP